jgi:hypothetical protein
MGFRTKWKRQTAVGLELLAEAGNYAAVQRMLQSNPYWFTYHPQATSIISNFDALYYRQGESSLTSPRPTLPRMFIHGLQCSLFIHLICLCTCTAQKKIPVVLTFYIQQFKLQRINKIHKAQDQTLCNLRPVRLIIFFCLYPLVEWYTS